MEEVANFPHFSDFHGDFLRWFSPTLAETLTPHAATSLPGQNFRQDVSCKWVLFLYFVDTYCCTRAKFCTKMWMTKNLWFAYFGYVDCWCLFLLDESTIALSVEKHKILKLLEVYFANLCCQFIVGVGTVIDIDILTSNQWRSIQLFKLYRLSKHLRPCYLM